MESFYDYGNIRILQVWHILTQNGDSLSPEARDDMTMVWDTQNNRLLLFGGVSILILLIML